MLPCSDSRDSVVIGVVSPGEMGTALALALARRGVCVKTTLAGRSEHTIERCRGLDCEILPTVTHVGKSCDVLLSTVTPGAAFDVAAQVRREYRPNWRMRTFVDVNSVAPETMCQIARKFADTPIQVVDAVIHGQASRLQEQATLYLSGDSVEAIAGLFQPAMRVRVLGSQPGQASAMKMLLGSMTKGLIAHMLQAGCLAAAFDSTETFVEELRHFYPEMTAFLERSLPTYPRHAGRRSEETDELATELARRGIDDALARAVERMFGQLADAAPGPEAAELETRGLPAALNEITRSKFWSAERANLAAVSTL